ncbi:MAG: amidohydrolase family protein [Gorillibacterium sp.]|nr:amidohydrolase family protein [Gorillibacterium sp.]
MRRKKSVLLASTILLIGLFIYFLWFASGIKPLAETESSLQNIKAKAAKLNENTNQPTLAQLVDMYKDLGLIDAHNHDASNRNYNGMLEKWKIYAVQGVVLFGDVSEPSARGSDKNAWLAYQQNPDQFIPFFSGFDLHDEASLNEVRNLLEQGYFGLGEVAAASTVSPVVSKVALKANDPLDGYLPQIYDLIATYKAPILLHIDPPSGMPIAKLEQALEEHPQTIMIFGHINAYNTPEEIDRLLSKHPNLYADFFAGFSVYNPDGGRNPEQFIPVMKKYADRFLISTDSGYGIESEELAIDAMYRILYLLDDPAVARKIAHDNLAAIIQAQSATRTQLELLRKLEHDTGKTYNLEKLSKLEAGKILAEVSKG